MEYIFKLQIIVKNKQWKGDWRGGKEKQKIDWWFLLSYQSQISLSFYQGHFSLTQLKGCNFISPSLQPAPHSLPYRDQLRAHTHTTFPTSAGPSSRLVTACRPCCWSLLCPFRLTWNEAPPHPWSLSSCFTLYSPMLFLNIFSKSFFKKSNKMWWAFVLIISLTLVSAIEAQAPFGEAYVSFLHL